MYEIYEKHSLEYDELLGFEDYERNLPAKLKDLFDFQGKKVLEFGSGTGRLTAMYAGEAAAITCFDRSLHMLDKARLNLSQFKGKISYKVCDNNDIDSLKEKGDFVIEGWSFGHTVSDFEENCGEKADELIQASLCRLNRGGTAIFIETLGTDSGEPGPPSPALGEFYRRLEEKFGFSRIVIPTDYRFSSPEEAARICGFFFGPGTGEAILRKGSPVVKEFTGLWYKEL